MKNKNRNIRFNMEKGDECRAWKREQPFSSAVEKFIGYAKCFLGMDKA